MRQRRKDGEKRNGGGEEKEIEKAEERTSSGRDKDRENKEVWKEGRKKKEHRM